MKQYVARLLVFLCIISFTPMKEVVKAPLILIHYVDHLETSPDMTWEQFFFMHYTLDIHFDDDFAQDRQLPFKTIEYSQLPFFVLSENQLFQFYGTALDFDTKNKLNASYSFTIKDTKLNGIFHPPRLS